MRYRAGVKADHTGKEGLSDAVGRAEKTQQHYVRGAGARILQEKPQPCDYLARVSKEGNALPGRKDAGSKRNKMLGLTFLPSRKEATNVGTTNEGNRIKCCMSSAELE